MATYTDNYQLTKPTYAEQADIGEINSNMNKIDNIMHSSQISLAPAYDSTKSYAEGDVVMYELLMYKCISPTTGVWDGSKWERTTASESGGGGSAELDILGEASGAVASFADGASAGLAKCIAEINPTQDLHGYSKPWAGGAGKNVLPMRLASIKANNTGGTWNGNVYTLNNLTFEVLIDSDENVVGIKVNGTNSNTYTRFTLSFPTLENGTTYTLSGAPSGYSGTDATIYLGNSQTTIGIANPAISGGVPATFTPTQTGAPTANLNVNANVSVDNAIFYPQIEVGSRATTFEPYSNICPISGHSSVTINVSPTNDPSQGVDTTIQLGDTYYGGTLNVVKGELVVDRALVTITSESQFSTFSADSTYGSLATIAEDGKISNSEIMAIESMGVGISFDNRVSVDYNDKDRVYVDNTGKLRLRASNTVTISTKADMLARFNGVQVCYYLETPITVQLTPTEIATLLGQNYISSEDTGDIDIVYVKASAPIQPNPTGTPTATLKKLGIEGTVFEIPSGGGGGGSSDTRYSITEQKIGTVEDENGIAKDLYERMWIGTIPSYTSSANGCILGTMPSDYDEIIDIKGSLKGLVKAYGTVNGLDLLGWRGDLHINTDNQILLFAENSGNVTNLIGGKYRVIIQYTKTTD